MSRTLDPHSMVEDSSDTHPTLDCSVDPQKNLCKMLKNQISNITIMCNMINFSGIYNISLFIGACLHFYPARLRSPKAIYRDDENSIINEYQMN